MSTFSESAGSGPDGESEQHSPGVPASAEQGPSGAMDSGGRRSPTPELTALAAHLRRISDRVDQVATAHTELAALVSERLAPEITALRNDTVEQLSVHATQIHQILTATEVGHNPPIDWPAMTADQAATAWGDLACWIAEVLVPWYQITRDELPDCWAMHRPAVVELSWLRSAHIEAFAPNTAAHHAADWHTRWRPAALARLREVIPRHGTRSCAPGEHLVPDHERVRRHPAPPPPPPTPIGSPPATARRAVSRTPPLGSVSSTGRDHRPGLAAGPRDQDLARQPSLSRVRTNRPPRAQTVHEPVAPNTPAVVRDLPAWRSRT